MSDPDQANRRSLLIASGVGVTLAVSGSAQAAPRPAPSRGSTTDREQLDRIAIADLVLRERAARDSGEFAEMAAAYHPDSMIEVSWFKGDGAAFVEATRKNLASGRLSLHQMAPAIVTVKGERALADSACQLVAFVDLDGVPVSITNYARLMWRAQLLDGRWLISGLRMIYIRDLLVAVNPNNPPKIDEKEAARFRQSYRYLSYFFSRSEHPARDDLPGIDRPETVAALRDGELKWLNQG